MGFLEERDLSDAPRIAEYFAGKTIFITGGSGFIGKVLIEKLLYNCSDLDRIYVLMREKKGVKSEDRLSQIYSVANFRAALDQLVDLNYVELLNMTPDDPSRRGKVSAYLTIECFDRLRREKPDVFKEKVFVVSGDVGCPGLGITEEDRALLVNRVNVVFHVAASVRFDDPLTYAAKLNLRGTKEMVELANDMTNLSSFVHVSTSYSNTNRDPVGEVMYPPLADWRDTLAVCQDIDEHTLRMLTPKYLGETPNTYTFTKQLAEHVVYERRGQLPAVIVRPSIVIASVEEPVPGWIENFNGPVGIFVACGKGIMRSIHTRPDLVSDYIPVDTCVKHIIAAAWIRGTKELETTDDIPIYNCCSGKLQSIVMTDLIELSKRVAVEVPLDGALWTAGGHVTTSATLHYFKVLVQHLLPAILVDMLLWLFGKKTMLVKIQRRIYIANLALRYFLTQQWTFDNKNFVDLRSSIKKADISDFYYDIEKVDIEEYFRTCCYSGRLYLLKEKDEDLPSAKKHQRRLIMLDNTVKALFYGFVIWWICKIVLRLYGDILYDTFLL